MPKPTKFYPCFNKDCDARGVEKPYNAPAPINCYCGVYLDNTAYFTEEDDSSDDDGDPDFIVPRARSPRPAWNPGRRKDLTKRRTSIGGTLTCAICKHPIEVNKDGKEEWRSVSGKMHYTAPPIDHYDDGRTISTKITGGVPGVRGDWVQRKKTLRENPRFQDMDRSVQKKIEKAVYNASPLRITHMFCNCSRPKKRFL
jgi:hypothetical protein